MAPPFIFLGVDLSLVNWYLVLYILFSIAVVAMGVTKLFPMGTSTAVIYGIGSIMTLVFYYYRWFGNSAPVSSTWPPTLNTCPDYLTYIESLPGDKKPGCIDMLGVSKNGQLRLTGESNLISLSSTNGAYVFPFTSVDVANATSPTLIKAICTKCRTLGITWEGVFDGDNCTGIANSAAAAEADSNSCSAYT